MTKLFTILILLLLQLNSKAQHAEAREYVLENGSCRWDSLGIISRKKITYKTGYLFERFGTLIININGGAYTPCNLPPGLTRARVLISAVVYKKMKTDGTPIKLTYLKVLPERER